MVRNAYREMKERQQKIVDNFDGWFFAFSNEQFENGMLKIGLKPEEINKIVKLGAGGYIRKDRLDALEKMFDEIHKELKAAIESDKDGSGFIYDMFVYELENYEFCYSGDVDDTLDALGLTMEDVKSSIPLSKGLGLAIEHVMTLNA